MIGEGVFTIWLVCDGPSCREKICAHGADLAAAIASVTHEGWRAWPASGVASCPSCLPFGEFELRDNRDLRHSQASAIASPYGAIIDFGPRRARAIMAKMADWLDVFDDDPHAVDERIDEIATVLHDDAQALAFARAVERWREIAARRTPRPYGAS